MLPPFIAIFSGQQALSVPFPITITAFHVIAAPDIRRLIRIGFISRSLLSNSRVGGLTFLVEKKSDYFFLKWSSYFIFKSPVVCLLNQNCDNYSTNIFSLRLFYIPMQSGLNFFKFFLATLAFFNFFPFLNIIYYLRCT